MIATALAQPADRPDRREAQWRQLVDLLAQRRPGSGDAAALEAYAILRATRDLVAPAVRRQAALALAGRRVDPELIAFFTEDNAAVAAPLLAAARLEPEAWIAVLPRLGPAARALLRHRDDLDPRVRQALAAFGPSDFVLEGAGAPAAETGESKSQIRELVARIEAYRKQRDSEPPAAEPAPMPALDARPADGFRWETGTDGILVWVEGAPRGALVGQSIAWIAGPGQYGVDGQAAGGFEKRAPFRDARFSVAGDGPAAGDWRISGIPFFDHGSGSFLGYRGTARRPRPDEIARAAAEAPPQGVFGTQFPADSLRQLIHELRTPLNAIIGFAEMIEGQYMGPAAAPYRGRAAAIIEQARGLLGAVDDLDTAARLESRRSSSTKARSTPPPCCGGCTTPTPASRRSAGRGSTSRSPRACRRRGSSRPPPSACSPACWPAPSASPARARRSAPALPWRRPAPGRCSVWRSIARARSPASARRRC